jgi:hypothetical protein
MATPPVFSSGAVLTAAQMNSVGMWLISKTTIGSAVATVTTGTVFSSDYDNYRVIIRGVKSSLGGNLLINFGATVTGYYGTLYYDSYTGASTGAIRRNNGANLQCGTGENILAEQVTSMDIANPFLATSTSLSGTYYGNAFSGWFGGTQASTTSFTTLTIRADGGTLTGGTITVYGYRSS